ncbi:MAG: phosphodiester glycosidase family protein [Salaquimonas sp.]
MQKYTKEFGIYLLPLIAMGVAWVLSSQVHAQDAANRPARAAEAANALKMTKWREIEDGLSVITASTALGTKLTALKISSEMFRFSVEVQNQPSGERASSVLERTGATIVVNGGFFGLRADGSLYPVGQLVDDGAVLSSPWNSQGGFLSVDGKGEAKIIVSQNGLPSTSIDAIQSRPVLIEPGRKWAMRTNGLELERRTMLCELQDGDYILFTVSGGGLTLYEAGWLFRGPEWGGFFDCDSAIAMDGGGSTQLSIRGQSEFDITALTPVHNFLAISRR